MKNKVKILIAFAILVAVALRIYFLKLPGFAFDIGQFLKWGNAISQNGFWGVYGAQNIKLVDNYPPLIPVITSWWMRVGSVAGLRAQVTEIFKILPTVFEIVLITVSAILVTKSKIKYKPCLLVAIIISPALALTTTAWGQAEAIFVLFIVLGFILAQNHKYLATTMMILATLTKPQAVPAVAIYFIYLFFMNNTQLTINHSKINCHPKRSEGSRPKAENRFARFLVAIIIYSRKIFAYHSAKSGMTWGCVGRKNIFRQGIFFVAVFATIEILFRKFGGTSFVSLYLGGAGLYKNLSLNAFNFWWLIYGSNSWNVVATNGGMISFQSVGLMLFLISEIPAILYLKSAKKIEEIFLVLGFTYLSFFVFMTQMHERYLYPAVAFLAIAAVIRRKIFATYLIISVTFLLNIFAVLQSVYPQFSFLRYNLLAYDWTRWVALVNVATVLFLFSLFLYPKKYDI